LYVIQGQIGGSALIRIDQFDIEFGYIIPFMHQFCMMPLPHGYLLIKSFDHLSESGLYAVTKTAGDEAPFGIPYTT